MSKVSPLVLTQPEAMVDRIIGFIRSTFATAQKDHAVVAVSGGIDSALVLTLTCQALGSQRVYPVFLPYADQSIADSELISEWNGIPANNWLSYNIADSVNVTARGLGLLPDEHLRFGNLMARTRMIMVFDVAKRLEALVCGTENNSEKHLGYFTRFGDEASDLEPIHHLYKTQVRQLAQYLKLPAVFTTKAPSAGLWANQTDETELGFSYEQADQVLYCLIEQQQPASEIVLQGIDSILVQKVADRVQQAAFKQAVPYHFTSLQK